MRKALLFLCLVLSYGVLAQTRSGEGIDPDALIEQIVSVSERQKAEIHDIVFDAELIEYEYDDGRLGEETARFTKKIYVLMSEDTNRVAEEYLAYYIGDSLQSEDDLQDEATKRIERKKKRNTGDVSFPIMRPFLAESRDRYKITFQGVTSDEVEGYACYKFLVKPHEPDRNLVQGTYYFETGAFHLVRVEFSPSKLPKGLMFKLRHMEMTMEYEPTPDGHWLPSRFDIRGEGKAALFVGVRFAATEYYRNPQINQGIDPSVFEEEK